jgi:hypothetical protein
MSHLERRNLWPKEGWTSVSDAISITVKSNHVMIVRRPGEGIFRPIPAVLR